MGSPITRKWKRFFGIPLEDKVVESTPPPEPEKEISEPVFAFVEMFKQNPRRFKLFYLDDVTTASSLHKLGMLIDKEQGLSFHWRVQKVRKVEHLQYHHYERWVDELQNVTEAPFLTYDEKDYLYKEISGFLTQRNLRYQTLLAKRRDRANQKLREHFIGIYEGVAN